MSHARHRRLAATPRRRRRLMLEGLEARTLMNVDFRYQLSIEAPQIEARATTVDSSGNAYLVGTFAGTADFAPGASTAWMTGAGAGDAFVAKYNTSGGLVWARQLGGAGLVEGTGIALDGSGNVLVAGTFEGSADFDPGAAAATLTSAGGADAFVVKLNSGGNYAWSKRLGGAADDRAAGLAVDGSGNVLVAGTFSGAGDFNPDAGTATLTSAGATDAFVVKLNASGTYQWSKRFGGASADEAAAIAADGSGDGFVAGRFEGAVTYNGRTFYAGTSDAFVMKVTASGGEAWARRLGGPGLELTAGLAVDAQGSVYVAGTLVGSADLETDVYYPDARDTLKASGPEDAFVVSLLGTNGGLRWARTVGGSDVDRASAIAVDAAGVYLAGTYRGGQADLAPGVRRGASAGERDGFAARLTKEGVLAWARGFGGAADDVPRAIAANLSGRLYVAGYADGPGTFGPFYPASAPGGRLFLTRMQEIRDDYDGNGVADVATFRPSTGQWTTQLTPGGSATLAGAITTHAAGDMPVPADFDGDGVTDKAVYRPSTSDWYIRPSSTGVTQAASNFGQGTLYGGAPVPIVGDFDGDGRADVGVYQPTTSDFYLSRSTAGNTRFNFGQGTLFGGNPVPFVGDFDGDGRADVAVYQPASSTFYFRLASGGANSYQFGTGTDFGGDPVPIAGDFDGDGKSDYGAYQRDISRFELRRTTAGNTNVDFGQGTDFGGNPRPVIADFDWDGKSDPGVFQVATGGWTIQQSAAGARSESVGQANDIPLPPPAEVPAPGGGGGLSGGLSGGYEQSEGGGINSPPVAATITIGFSGPTEVEAGEGSGVLTLAITRQVADGSLDDYTTTVSLSSYDLSTEIPGVTYADLPLDYESGQLSHLEVVFGYGQAVAYVELVPRTDGLAEPAEYVPVLLASATSFPADWSQPAPVTQIPGANSKGRFKLVNKAPGTGTGTGTPPPGDATGGDGTAQNPGTPANPPAPENPTGGGTSGGSAGSGSTPLPPTIVWVEPPLPPAPIITAPVEVTDDNADYLSTGESRLGITDGPVWIGASSGDVVISPNAISPRGGGRLPEWRSDNFGEVVLTFDWTLPANVSIAEFQAELVVGKVDQNYHYSSSDWVTFSTAGLTPGQAVRFSLRVQGNTLLAGLNPWHMFLKASTAGGTSTQIFYGTAQVVDRFHSATDRSTVNPMGLAWWVPDLDQLVPSPYSTHWQVGPGYSWIRGDGTAAWFPIDGSGNFVTPDGSFFTLAYQDPAHPNTSWFVLTGVDGTTLTFDHAGLLRSRSDRHGNTTNYAYTAGNGDSIADDLSQVTDPFGRTTTFHYDTAAQRLSYVEDFAGRRVNYSYKATVNPIVSRIDWPDAGNPTWLEFDSPYYGVDVLKQPGGRQITIGYDVGPALVRTLTKSEGGSTLASWAVAPMQRRTLAAALPVDWTHCVYVDPRGYTWLFETDRFGYLVETTDPMGRVTTLGRNADGLVESLTTPDPDGPGPDGRATTTYQYDAMGRMELMTLPSVPGEGVVQRGWTYAQSQSATTPTKFWDTPTTYIDELGRVTTNTINAATGDVTLAAAPLSRSVAYTYDARGMILTVTAPDPDGTVTTLSAPVTTYEYQHPTRADLPTKQINPDGSFRTFAYDAYDRLWQLTDELGRVTTFLYDGFDRLYTVTYPDPNPNDSIPAPAFDYRYNAHGELIQMIGPDPDGPDLNPNDPDGAKPRPVTEYTYDGLGRVTQVKGPDADENAATTTDRPTSTFAYDAGDNLVASADPLGRTTYFGYDPAGQLTAVVDPAGGVARFAYDGLGRLVASADPLGRVATSKYDARGRLVRSVDARGYATQYAYDKVGNLKSVTDPLNRVVTYDYDDADRLIKLTMPDPDGGDPLPAPIFDYQYDRLDRLTKVLGVDPDGASVGLPRPETVYTYFNPSQRKVVVTRPDADGNPATTADAWSETYLYDAGGRLTQHIDPLSRVTTYDYDALDQLTSVTAPDPDGGLSKTSPVALYAYDYVGRLIRESVTDLGRIAASQTPLESTSYAYDGLGRLVGEVDGRGTHAYAYDLAGRLTSTTDRLGHATTYQYDALDRLIKLTTPDPDGNAGTPNDVPIWTYAYDDAGQLRLATDPAGGTTAYAYDEAGNVVSVRDPVGSVTRYTYDAVGNLKTLTDPNNNVTTYTYDALDRLTREQASYAASTDRTYTYDAAGNLDVVKDRSGRSIDYDHDNRGRVKSEKWLAANSSTVVRTIAYTYTTTDQILTVDDRDVDYAFTYDNLDRPLTETANFNNLALVPAAFSSILTSDYDSAGRRISLTDNKTGTIAYGYDGYGRMTSAALSVSGVLGPKATLGYDNADRLTSITRQVGSGARSILSTLTYDNADRLRDILHVDSADALPDVGDATLASFNYELDPAGRLLNYAGTKKDGTSETRTYTYDPAGQLKSEQVGSQAAVNYAYDVNGNRTGTGLTVQAQGNKLTEDSLYRYYYDDEGNLIRREEKATTKVRLYTWDHRNRLISVVDRASLNGAETQRVEYTYDAFDRRVGRAVDPDGAGTAQPLTRTWTVYDGADVHADLNASGNVVSRYLSGPAVDMLLARYDQASGDSTWYLTDRLGSTRALARIGASAAQVVDRIDYDAFGNAAESNAAAGDRFKFTGRELDDKTGLYYYRARYYDAATGRFLGEDPAGYAAGDANLYRYVGNGPTNATDPSGLQASPTTGGGGGAGGGGVAFRPTQGLDSPRMVDDAGNPMPIKPSRQRQPGWTDQLGSSIREGVAGFFRDASTIVNNMFAASEGWDAGYRQGTLNVANAATDIAVDTYNQGASLANQLEGPNDRKIFNFRIFKPLDFSSGAVKDSNGIAVEDAGTHQLSTGLARASIELWLLATGANKPVSSPSSPLSRLSPSNVLAEKQVGSVFAGRVGLIGQLKLHFKHRALLQQLKKGVDVPLSSVVTGARTRAKVFGLMGELTAAASREVALLRTRAGLILRMGPKRIAGKGGTVSAARATRVLAHSHTRGYLHISTGDYTAIFMLKRGFKQRPHKSTIVVGPTGGWRRYTSDQGILGGTIQ